MRAEPMRTQLYTEQAERWPKAGRHILAHFDTDSIYVYQAYRPSIANFAVRHQRFGGDFSYSRMSWIKPNFLWMMYRSGWASKEAQERILAVRLPQSFFEELLERAVESSYTSDLYSSHEEWQKAVASSEVRLQWDPDHDPAGCPVERRAVQLGLRGEMLYRYGTEAPLSIEDITPFVIEQRQQMLSTPDLLMMPEEHVYRPGTAAARVLGLNSDLSSSDLA